MSTAPQARAEEPVERLFPAHSGCAPVDVINSKVIAEVIRRANILTRGVFIHFLKDGVFYMVNISVTRPMAVAQTSKLLRSTAWTCPKFTDDPTTP